MRLLIYTMTPILILTVLLASRFLTWDAIKGEKRQAQKHVQHGTSSLRAWKLPEAIAAFTQAIEIEPSYAEAYMKRGLAYYRSAQYEAAITDYTHTLEFKRYQADAYASRGDVYRTLKDTRHALEDYSASLKHRWSPYVTWKRAAIYLTHGDFQNALADYDTVAERHPTMKAYYVRGNTYLQLALQGDESLLKSAEADLDQAIDLEPRFALTYIRRAQIYTLIEKHALATIDYTNAVELLTDAIQTWQGNANALILPYYWRAFAHQKLGKNDKAQKDINEIYKQVFHFLLKK